MDIQNKNDELQRELMEMRRQSADRFNMQRTIEKYYFKQFKRSLKTTNLNLLHPY